MTNHCYATILVLTLGVYLAPAHSEDSVAPEAKERAAAEWVLSPVALIIDLARAVRKQLHYSGAESLPRVSLVSHAVLAAHACRDSCARVKAAYVPGEGIYVENTLDPEHRVFDRSILFHELVHFVQEQVGEFSDLGPCGRHQQEEMQAYALQNAYLMAQGRGGGEFLPPRSIPCS